jgi:ketosteroid isomerase-like protein
MNQSNEKSAKVVAINSFFEAYAVHDMDGILAVLAENIAWTIPGQHPLAGTKHGIPEVLSFFDALATAEFKADPVFLEASQEYVVDIHRGWSSAGEGKVDTMWALVWHFNNEGKVDRVINLCGDQAQMDTFCWANYPLAPLPGRLAMGDLAPKA